MKKSLKPLTFYDAIDSNKKKTWLIVFSISLLLFIVVYAIGYWFEFGWISVPIAFLAVFFTNFYAYYNSDKIILNISGAREPTKEEYPYLINVVEGLSIAGGIPVPKIYVIDDPSPNAFATGRDPQNSAIAVTTGLLEKLDRLELEGVIAHEISHIKHYDVRLQTISAVMVGMIVILGDALKRSLYWGGKRDKKDRKSGDIIGLIALLIAILSPILATLLRFALSRQREYMADAGSAMLTRYPEGLASALEKIAKDPLPVKRANSMTAPLYIVNPLDKSWGENLLSTHPPVEERIRRLRMMGDRWKLLEKEGR
ncbi:MAG: zinc metalloprotease HtpX [Dictyoglomus sp.]|nr:zinc metalloprotease HtpX [Dictyoglomus sp.]MDW8188968.1 zinc metalloprotease HtpX [Dictyoglomus sp.]